MFTSIVVGVDCREGGRDALALAKLLMRPEGESSSLCMLRVRAAHPRDVLIIVEDELAGAGATGERSSSPTAPRSRTAHRRRPRGR